jgi:hypothetical protein
MKKHGLAVALPPILFIVVFLWLLGWVLFSVPEKEMEK